MTYSTLLEKENVESQFLVVIKPRKILSDWTLDSGTKYYKSFTLGNIVTIEENGTALTEATTSTLSDGEWYFDADNNIIWYDNSKDVTTVTIVTIYEIFISTFDAYWYRDPLDNTSRVVYYEPLISNSPTIRQSNVDLLSGFIPIQSSAVSISNVTQFLQEHVYDSSFNNVDLNIYHYLDELTDANIKLIFPAKVNGISSSDDNISLTIYDRNSVLDNQWRTVGFSNEVFTYLQSIESGLDPSRSGYPIRFIFGMVDGVQPTNLDYNDTAPSVTNNREWSVSGADKDGTRNLYSEFVITSASNTTTTTYLDTTNEGVNGFNVGDAVYIEDGIGSAITEYAEVTLVNTTSNYIEHTTIGTVASVGNLVRRGDVARIEIKQGSEIYNLRYIRDYTVKYFNDSDTIGFTLVDDFEYNHGGLTLFTPIDLIWCRFYGQSIVVNLGGSPFGVVNTTYNNITNGIVIIYWILRVILEVPESDIDTDTFEALALTQTETLSFAVPSQSTEELPIVKDVLNNILRTMLLTMYINDDNKWTLKLIEPMSSSNKTIQDDEIIANSLSYTFDYNDIVSEVLVRYNEREIGISGGLSSPYFNTSQVTNQNTKYLHKVKKQKSMTSLLKDKTDADILSQRMGYIFSDRKGVVSISTKHRFFDSEIGDVTTLERTRLAGFAYDEDVDRTRNLKIVETAKNINGTLIKLDDHKGIEDNSSSW